MTSVPWLAVTSLLAAVGTLFLIAHLRQYRGKPGVGWFLASLGWQTATSVAYGVGLLVTAPGLRWVLEAVVWVGITGTGLYFFAFATAYTGRGHLLERWHAVVAALPAVVGVLVLTNPSHHVAWTGYRISPVDGMTTVSYTIQPWTLAIMTAGALVVVAGSLLLFDTVVSYGPLYRGEAVAVGLSTVPPLTALLVWAYGLGPVDELNLTTTLFLPHIALDAYAFVGSDMFEFHPATRRAGERAAIDDLGAPVVIVDEAGRVVTLNDAATSAFGVGKTAALTRPLDDILDDPVLDPPAPGVDGDRPDASAEAGSVTVRGDGNRTVYSVTATPLTDATGTHVGYTVVFQDVTAERRREQRLNVLNRVLRHNLRNDMTVVRGFAEAAAERIDDEAAVTMLDRADETAADLLALGEKARQVEDVLDRDRETGRVRLAPLVDTVVGEHAVDHPDATVRTAAVEDLVVRTDPVVLEVVLDALVENALVHGGDPPRVAVTGERRDGGVAVHVADEGPGIPDHELAVIDEGVESALEHGSGLGLWLANWGATSLGGDLSFAVDGGTTATVWLPDS